MCFTVLLATDGPADLSLHDGQGVLFRLAEPDEARAAKLLYPYVYDVVGDKEGCACCFDFYGDPYDGSHPFWDNGGFRRPAKSGEETAQEQRETLYLPRNLSAAASSETAPKCRLPACGAATGRNCANPP